MNDPSLPNVTVQQLEYLVAAAREPTFARAASSVGVSPSGLSQGLAVDLERRVGVSLFEPSGRGRVLADQAEEVVRYVERVLAETGELARWVDGRHTGRAGPRVGMIDVAAVDHFSEPLRAFRLERPDVELRLTVAPSGELLDLLGRGALELAVCVAPETEVALAVTPLRDEPLAVYAPPGVRVGPPARWGPWVTFPAGSRTRTIIADAVAGRRRPLRGRRRVPPARRPGRDGPSRGGLDGPTGDPGRTWSRPPGPCGQGRAGSPLPGRRPARLDRAPSPAADALVDALSSASGVDPAARAAESTARSEGQRRRVTLIFTVSGLAPVVTLRVVTVRLTVVRGIRALARMITVRSRVLPGQVAHGVGPATTWLVTFAVPRL